MVARLLLKHRHPRHLAIAQKAPVAAGEILLREAGEVEAIGLLDLQAGFRQNLRREAAPHNDRHLALVVGDELGQDHARTIAAFDLRN